MNTAAKKPIVKGPSLVISLDFEMFWGVVAARPIADYRSNVEGEWQAIPRMLALFRQHEIRATWATVGMVMCRDYRQWREIRPSVPPGFARRESSAYSHDALARAYPRLFFAQPLVEQIQATPGQEVASHTFSHFYCGEKGATPEQFSADLACAGRIASHLGLQQRSLVFPRNQVLDDYVALLPQHGFRVYRGNLPSWMYRDGDDAPGGLVRRGMRLLDSWLPLSGTGVVRAWEDGGVTNLPASLFLRPWSRRYGALEAARLNRIKRSMTLAAREGECCHLWWHPHNFGVNLEPNLVVLEELLLHYRSLRDRYGMQSRSMDEFAPTTV